MPTRVNGARDVLLKMLDEVLKHQLILVSVFHERILFFHYILFHLNRYLNPKFVYDCTESSLHETNKHIVENKLYVLNVKYN